MKTLEDFKDLLLVLRIYANAVIPNGKKPILASRLCREMNLQRLAASVAYRITDQILKDLLQLKIVKADARKGGAGNTGSAFFNRGLKTCKRFIQAVSGLAVQRSGTGLPPGSGSPSRSAPGCGSG